MPRFVLLEHRWNGVHWDLMLESGDILATWAIDEAIEPGKIVQARALPDHRIVYLDYEGPISGDRGEVTRLDRGTYEIETRRDDRLVINLKGDQLRGEAALWRVGAEGASCWLFRLGKAD